MKNYKTVFKPHEIEKEIKKSRFISLVFHVENEEEVALILSEIRKKHYKATHICSAYVLNTTPERQKASDDGEPAGTAGKPILEVINHRELKDVLVVVIRYFGGIKLGAGGLIRAYGSGGSDVLNQCQIVKMQFSQNMDVIINYPSYGGFINSLQEKKIVPVSEDFGENVQLSFQIPVEEVDIFKLWVEDITNGNAKLLQGKEEYIKIAVTQN
ncbi:MAG: YigZ family protein [Eubacteriaceae bacterium]